MWLRLGYGQPTGIDVAGEVGGIVRDPALTPWREIDLANGAFGQGVAVTPIQLAMAYAALMNGGTLVQPHVVKAVGDHDVTVAQRGQVVDGALSTTLIKMMQHVITEVPFYRDRTLVPGYDVGGKTGTAQIWDPTANGGTGRLEVQPVQLLVRRLHRPRDGRPRPRRGDPHRGGHARRSSRSAGWRCRSCRSSCSGGSRPMPSRRPTCCADAAGDP